MSYIYITMLHFPMTVNHQISFRTQYQTTTGYTEKLYHENASPHLISHKKKLITATLISKTLKNPKISEFENITLFLTKFVCTINSVHKIGIISESIQYQCCLLILSCPNFEINN